jgi:serine/threonine protein phosphatase PrpC
VKVAYISEQGRRSEMEDAHFLDANFGHNDWIYGGIYDGHNGSFAARYAASHLHNIFLNKYLSSNLPLQAFTGSYEEISNELTYQESGSTAVDFFIKDGKIYTANAGDARAIIVSQDAVHQLTIDHRLGNTEEEQRIIRMGGDIQPPYVIRGSSSLMPTRTIGDEYFKPVGIIAVPSVYEYKIKKEDLVLIAACDGLFDFMDNDEIAMVTHQQVQPETLLENLKREVLINRHGSDNLTIIAVTIH